MKGPLEISIYRPVALDGRALRRLAPTKPSEGKVCYWLVGNPSINLNRGRPLEHAQLALLIPEAV
jgi:hypothetical protein